MEIGPINERQNLSYDYKLLVVPSDLCSTNDSVLDEMKKKYMAEEESKGSV